MRPRELKFKVAALAAGVWLASLAGPATFHALQETIAQFYGPDQNANAVREYETATTRAFVEGMGLHFRLTSAYRTDSDAHKDGAIDFTSNVTSSLERHAQAAALSKVLGPQFSVIVEESGPGSLKNDGLQPVIIATHFRTQTTYINGNPSSVHFAGPEATHTHVQRVYGTKSSALIAALHLTPTAGSAQMLDRLLGPTFIKQFVSRFVAPPNPGSSEPPSIARAIVKALASGRALAGNGSHGLTSENYSGGSAPWGSEAAATNAPISFSSPNISINAGADTPTMAPGSRMP